MFSMIVICMISFCVSGYVSLDQVMNLCMTGKIGFMFSMILLTAVFAALGFLCFEALYALVKDEET